MANSDHRRLERAPISLGDEVAGGADQVLWPVPRPLLSNLGPTKTSMLCF